MKTLCQSIPGYERIITIKFDPYKRLELAYAT